MTGPGNVGQVSADHGVLTACRSGQRGFMTGHRLLLRLPVSSRGAKKKTPSSGEVGAMNGGRKNDRRDPLYLETSNSLSSR